MDETKQYKQRLEAIAEKRRLQEEQDRARREKEDERLRQQQLKRKSLRDQWLMEGTPLSPTSPNTHSPQSSLWSSQTQDMEKPSDNLQPENQRLAEEQETQEAVKVAEAGTEKIQDVVQNGQVNVTRSETSDADVKKTQISAETEAAVVLTNGQGHLEENSNHNNSEPSVLNQNGPISVFESVGGIKPEPEMNITEAASGPNISINEEEEEVTLVMRAEPVFITDEADDVPEDLSSQEDQQESDRACLPQSETGIAAGEVLEQEVETEIAPELIPDLEKSKASELTMEAQPAAEEKDVEGGAKSCSTNADEEETKTKVQEGKMEDPVCVPLQSPASALEGTTVAPVPVYSEVPLSALSPEAVLQAKAEASATPVEEEADVKVENPACQPSQFQEVPLSEPQENQRKEAEPGEQEPLLLKVQACTVSSAGSTPNPVTTETLSPTTRSQETETQPPKHKTCQCCSVM